MPPEHSPRLIVLTGSARGRRLPLGHRALIGRDAACGLRYPDLLVSRRHALISCNATGTSLVDLDSRTGTFINGRKLSPQSSERLCPGDLVQLGDGGPISLFLPDDGRGQQPIGSLFLERADGEPGGPWSFDIAEPKSITLGRHAERDVVLSSPRDQVISRHHATIHIVGSFCLVVDEHSANGLLVDQRRVSSQLLTLGSELQLGIDGGAHLRVVIGEAARRLRGLAAAAPAPALPRLNNTTLQTRRRPPEFEALPAALEEQLFTSTARPDDAFGSTPIIELDPSRRGALRGLVEHDEAMLACPCSGAEGDLAHRYWDYRRTLGHRLVSSGRATVYDLPEAPAALRGDCREQLYAALPKLLRWYAARLAYSRIVGVNAGSGLPSGLRRVASSELPFPTDRRERRRLLQERDELERRVARDRDGLAELLDDFLSSTSREPVALAEELLTWAQRRAKLELLRELIGELSGSRSGLAPSTRNVAQRIQASYDPVLARVVLMSFHEACLSLSRRLERRSRAQG